MSKQGDRERLATMVAETEMSRRVQREAIGMANDIGGTGATVEKMVEVRITEETAHDLVRSAGFLAGVSALPPWLHTAIQSVVDAIYEAKS